MGKNYYIEAKFGNRWTLIGVSKQQKNALEYVKNPGAVKYPMRVVRVVRTVVFDGTK